MPQGDHRGLFAEHGVWPGGRGDLAGCVPKPVLCLNLIQVVLQFPFCHMLSHVSRFVVLKCWESP